MLIGSNATWAGRSRGIPSDCIEVEYLETDGNSWIDTDVECLAVETELSIRMEKSAASYNHVSVGARNAVYLIWIDWYNKLINYAQSASAVIDSPEWNGFVDIVTMLNSSGSKLSFNGSEVTGRQGIRGYPGYRYALFSAACSGESYNQKYYISPAGERMAHARFSQEGIAVADFVPVRRVENGVSVGYMCDVLTGKLYGNSGAGAFGIGPDVCLPYDAEVEYLESTEVLKAGSQIIIPVGDRATFECKLQIYDTRDLKFMGLMYNLGGEYNGQFQVSTINGGYRMQGAFMGTLSVTAPEVVTNRPIVYKSPSPNNMFWTIDGVEYAVAACKWNKAGDFHLFHAGELNYTADKGRNRLYYCKIFEDGELVRDLIPVRVGWTGYMYDRVKREMFGNIGTGRFSLGKDVYHAGSYVEDGMLAQWDGVENNGYGQHSEETTVWKDLTGNGHDFEVPSDFKFGESALCIPDARNLVQRRKSTDYEDLKDGWTMEVVFKLHEEKSSETRQICGLGEQMAIWMYPQKSDGTRFPRFCHYSGFGGAGTNASGSGSNVGYSFADVNTMTLTCDVANAKTVFYVNGIFKGSLGSGGCAGDGSPTRVGFGINCGAGYQSSNGSSGTYSLGPEAGCDYYSFRVYSRALSEDEVLANAYVDERRFRKTAKDYIRPGLVAMWDGIENEGWGVHSDTVTVWNDLIGGRTATPVAELAWNKDSPVMDGTQYFTIPSVDDMFPDKDNLTVEVVCQEGTGSDTNSGVIGFSNGTARFMWYFFGYNVATRTDGSASFNYRGTSPVRVIYRETLTEPHSATMVCSGGVCNAYRNGVKKTWTEDVASGTVNPGSDNYIGYIKNYKALNGKIMSVRIYSRALTEEEIAANYEVDRIRFDMK